jgi:hypothetical protein
VHVVQELPASRVQPLHVVEGPFVDRADPIEDDASRTAEIPRRTLSPAVPAGPPDRLVPFAGSGLRGWLDRVRGVLGRTGLALLPIALLALLPMHFFAGRLEDTLIAAPALSDLAGGFGLLLLPVMWFAYFAVAALPEVICVAGVVGIVLPASADGVLPPFSTVWGSVAYRLRPLWLWLVPFGVLSQSLPLVLNKDHLGDGVTVPLMLGLGLASTAGLTFIGMLGCVILVEHGQGPRRAAYLLSLVSPAGLIGGALAFTALPRVAGALGGAVAASVVAVLAAVLWAVTALVTYAQARRVEGPVTSMSLRRELAAPEPY